MGPVEKIIHVAPSENIFQNFSVSQVIVVPSARGTTKGAVDKVAGKLRVFLVVDPGVVVHTALDANEAHSLKVRTHFRQGEEISLCAVSPALPPSLARVRGVREERAEATLRGVPCSIVPHKDTAPRFQSGGHVLSHSSVPAWGEGRKHKEKQRHIHPSEWHEGWRG